MVSTNYTTQAPVSSNFAPESDVVDFLELTEGGYLELTSEGYLELTDTVANTANYTQGSIVSTNYTNPKTESTNYSDISVNSTDYDG